MLSGPLEIWTRKPLFLTVGKGLLEPKLKHNLNYFKFKIPSSTQESYQAPGLGFSEGLIWETSNFQGASVLNIVLNLDLQSTKGKKRHHLNTTDKPSSAKARSHHEGKALMLPFLPGKHHFDSSVFKPWSNKNKLWLLPVAGMCL